MTAAATTPQRIREFILLGLLFVAAAWFYAWSPASFPQSWITGEPLGYYAELTEAYLDGRLHLSRTPPPQLTQLSDPYDPAQNAPYRVNDLSYYHGRYFVYHGPAPVLTLMVPFRVITGRYLTEPAAAIVFCLVGAVFSLRLLAELRPVVAPRLPLALLACCALAVLFANGYYLVLRNAEINRVAITSAHAYSSLALWALFRSLAGPSPARSWLLLASCAMGLAVASRPNYAASAAVLLVPLLARWRPIARDRAWTYWLSALGPLVIIVGGILAHNQLRFDHPLEFGQRFMLGGWDQRTLGFFRLSQVPANAWHYLFAPGIFAPFFPFVTAPTWAAVGVFVHAPFVWLAIAAGLPFLAHRSALAASRPFVTALVVSFGGNLALLLLLPSGNEAIVRTSANARYVFDFLPALVLLGCVGAMALDQCAAGRVWLRRGSRAATVSLTAVSLLFALSLDFQRLPAEHYRRLAEILNVPGHVMQTWRGVVYGPLRLMVIFPRGQTGATEPLVATGRPEAGDLLFVAYDSARSVRFGLVGTSMRGPLSPSIPVTSGEPHALEIRMGSLLPEIGHPEWSALDAAAVGYLKRSLQIKLDGRTVFEAPAHFFQAAPGEVTWGRTEILSNYSRREFSGRIVSVERLPLPADFSPPSVYTRYGALLMTLRLPASIPADAEPLVVTGLQGAGDFIMIRYLPAGKIAIGLDHWGSPATFGPALELDRTAAHVFEIHMGSLLPRPDHSLFAGFPSGEIQRLKQTVRVVINGSVALETSQPTYDALPYEVYIGKNVIGGSSSGYEFTGTIEAIERLPLPKPGD